MSRLCPRLSSAGRQQRGTHGGGGLGGVRLSPPSQRHHQPQGHRLHRWVANAASNCYTKATFPDCFHGGSILNPLTSVRSTSRSARLHHVHPEGTILLCSGFDRPTMVLLLVRWFCCWSAVGVCSCLVHKDLILLLKLNSCTLIYKKNKCLYYFCFSCSQPPVLHTQSTFGSFSLFVFVCRFYVITVPFPVNVIQTELFYSAAVWKVMWFLRPLERLHVELMSLYSCLWKVITGVIRS